MKEILSTGSRPSLRIKVCFTWVVLGFERGILAIIKRDITSYRGPSLFTLDTCKQMTKEGRGKKHTKKRGIQRELVRATGRL